MRFEKSLEDGWMPCEWVRKGFPADSSNSGTQSLSGLSHTLHGSHHLRALEVRASQNQAQGAGGAGPS